MIIKNEERYLEGCLSSVKGIVDEIVIVDTGSTDNSLKIAEKYNAKIFHFDWNNDFSAARNFALLNSRGDFILYLDADERLSKDSVAELKKLTNGNKLAGYKCTVESPSQVSGSSNVMKYVRLFANHPRIKFTGKAHEQIEDSLREKNFQIYDSNIKIIHLGYDVSEEELKTKAKRNLELLQKDYENNPSGYNAFQIGQTYVVLGDILKSEPYFLFAIEKKNIEINQLAHCYRYLAAIESNIKNDLDKSLEYVEAGLKISQKQPLLNVIASNVYLRKNDFDKAEEFVRKAYNYNEEINNSSSEFEISVKSEDMLNHCLNIAVLSCNVKLFNDFYEKYNTELNDKKRNGMLSLFNSVFNNYDIEEKLIEQSHKMIAQEFIPAFVFSLGSYRGIDARILVLEKFKAAYKNEIKILNLLGNSYLEMGNNEKAFENYEEAFLKSSNDPALLFSLISLSAELNKYDKLLSFINAAENNFKDNKIILEKLNSIKNKIISVSN
ncbi:MAG: hypothetical protein A2068_05390 [Ignavibacteria bacterium GWB2_35_6b]|nr:MAG: hypothetical protein A2068_05390 [Ignavibacteria bacterium GWB2_35_6b]